MKALGFSNPLLTGLFFGVLFSFWIFLTVTFAFFVGVLFGLISNLNWNDLSVAFTIRIIRNLFLYSLVIYPVGFIWGLGVGYGNRPGDTKGVLNIWIFAFTITITISALIFVFCREYVPEIKSNIDIAMLGALWLGFTSLLASLGLGQRKEVIRAAQKTNEAN